MGTMTFPVDVRNPGHFFACCGILYCSDRIFNLAEGYFDKVESGQDVFILETNFDGNPLEEIINKLSVSGNPCNCFGGDPHKEATCSLYMSDNPSDTVSSKKDDPLYFESISIWMDFWNHFDNRPKIKLFAGQESSINLIRRWMDYFVKYDNKMNDLLDLAEMDLPSGFDTSTSWNALDVGFSLNEQKMNTKMRVYPLIEFFAYMGVQTYSWEKNSKEEYSYRIWTTPLPIMLSRTVAAGALILPNLKRFNFFTKEIRQKKVLKRAFEVNL